MTEHAESARDLEARVRELEAEVERLRRGPFAPKHGATVEAPEGVRPVFDAAQRTVDAYFRDFQADPSRGTIVIAGERYLLVRAAALSHGFVDAICDLYSERGTAEARRIAKTLLFDMAHVIGASDARNFHRKMGVTDPVAKLSAGPVHFAYTGWAFVDILPESRATPDEDYCLVYHHPFSFESHSWLDAGRRTGFTVCAMSAGYSSGWCEESFGLPLTATEIACRARGDANCTFVMAPPHRLRGHLERILAGRSEEERRQAVYDIPALFERKHAEEVLRVALANAQEAGEAKGRFLANMSHEIRTPLTGILGMATLLRGLDLTAEQRDYVQAIDESGKALLSVLDDVLDVAKIDAGMMTVALRPCDVRGVLRDVATVLWGKVAEKGLALRVDVHEDVPAWVESDPLRLRQVVLNLAANAVKFTDAGRVDLRARWSAPGTLRVEVEDTGIGIEPSHIPRLFEDFTQEDTSPSRRHGGTGLGLSIARRFVTLLGGEIGAKSAPRVGSTFWLTLPARAAAAPVPARGVAPTGKVRPGARALLVEDDAVSRFVVQKLLQGHGLLVDTAVDGATGFDAWAAGAYDIVFMDCQMPGLDGYEATRRIRERERQSGAARTPVLAMTASVLPSDSARCREAGMDDLVPKPIDPGQLRDILARWVPAA